MDREEILICAGCSLVIVNGTHCPRCGAEGTTHTVVYQWVPLATIKKMKYFPGMSLTGRSGYYDIWIQRRMETCHYVTVKELIDYGNGRLNALKVVWETVPPIGVPEKNTEVLSLFRFRERIKRSMEEIRVAVE